MNSFSNRSNSHMLEGITKYLDYTGQFETLLKTVEDFENMLKTEDKQFLPTLYFLVKVEYSVLVDISVVLADALLKEPYVVRQLFKAVINLAVKSEEMRCSKNIGEAQVDVQVTLPLIREIMPHSEKCCWPRTGLFVIKGVIIARTVATKYCKSVVYRCPVEGCAGRRGERLFGDQYRANMCTYCGCVKEEFLRARINGEQVIAVFVNPNSFQSTFHRHEGITVCFKDDLIKDLSLGICYNVVASYMSPQYIGWGVERTTSEAQWRFNKNLPMARMIPPSILSLEERLQIICPNSPWAFTATLSSQIASHLYPATSFFQLKTGLLLSLASQDEDKVPAPLLALGPDCCSLLYTASQLSQRCQAITSAALCGSLGGTAGELWTEAGPLLLASGGVCYLGDWAKFGTGRSSVASQIIGALESGQVDLVPSANALLGSPPSQPLRSAVWTFWSGDKASSAAQAQLRTLIEVFGMPFIGDGGTDVEAVAEHLLFESMQVELTTPDDLIPIQDLKEYLKIVCSYKVQLTSEASKLIRNFFVASRRERPDCLPLKAIKTMTALAEAHARLCLRTQVIYEDVVLVAYLYEESITALFGPSLMSPPPSVVGGLPTDSKPLSIAEQMTLTLKSFSVWLEQYVKSLLSESSVNSSLSEE